MNKNISLGLQIAVSAITVLLIFFCVFWCGAIWGFSYPQYLITGGIGFLSSWFLISFFHELGHVVFGVFAAFKVERFKVFHITFYYKENRPTITIDSKSGLAGSCDMYPTREDDMEKRYFILSLGGIVSTGIIFFIILLLIIISAFTNLRPSVYPVFSFFVMWFPAAFFFTFFNLIPFENSDGKSDGAVLRGIKYRMASELTAVNALKIQAEMYRGLTPSQINPDLYFSAPQLMETDPNFMFITQMRYMYYNDMGDGDKAMSYINRLESIYEDVPASMKEEVAANLLFEYSLKSDEYKKVDGYFYDCLNLLKRKNAYSCRVMAAYELSFNRRQEAMECLDEAERLLKYEKIKGKALYEKNIISDLRRFV